MNYLCLIALLCAFASPLFSALHVDVSATSAVLLNSKTGKILYQKNATEPMYPASCTKIAFALYAIKFHQPLFNKRLITSRNAVKSMSETQKSKDNFSQVPSYVLENDASHMGLKVGEEMNFQHLLEATMVVSADDASNVLAEVMGNGSIEKCVDDVNRYMASLGLHSTRFTNPHGLHHPDHKTTALDLARLAQEAMKEPLFRNMASMPRFLRPKTNKHGPIHLQSTNRLLVKGTSSHYAPAIGIKTGYHRRAGHCLVAAAEQNDRSLIAVVLKSASREDRFRDTKKLFEAAFEEKKISKTFLHSGQQPFTRKITGASLPLNTYTTETIALSYYPSEEPQTRCQLVWHELEAPIKKDAPVGELHFLADGRLVKKTTLFAATGIDETFMHGLKKRSGLLLFIALAVVAGIGFFIFFRRR